MANRDVGISICGVVVGVMIGAGSVLYTQDVSLSASVPGDTVAAYWNLDDARDVNARNIEERNLEQVRIRSRLLNDAPRHDRTPAEAPAHAAAKDLSACGLATAITERFENQVRSVVPNEERSGDSAQRSALLANAQSIRDEYCAGAVEAPAEAPAMEKASPKRVDNDCEQYVDGSTRRATCEGLENKGLHYIGY